MNKVKGYRTMIKKSQVAMAAILGVSPNKYRRLEDNPEKFNLEMANKFLDEVRKVEPNCTFEEIFL